MTDTLVIHWPDHTETIHAVVVPGSRGWNAYPVNIDSEGSNQRGPEYLHGHATNAPSTPLRAAEHGLRAHGDPVNGIGVTQEVAS